MTHICVVKLTIIGSDNGLSPRRRQAIIWTNAGILLIGPLGTSFIEIFIGIQTFSFKEMHLKMSYGKWRPFCLGLNVLMNHIDIDVGPWLARHNFCDARDRLTPGIVTLHIPPSRIITAVSPYSISQEICTRFCCALLCCGYVIVHNEFK